jgi:hypothetical protein
MSSCLPAALGPGILTCCRGAILSVTQCALLPLPLLLLLFTLTELRCRSRVCGCRTLCCI